METARRIGGGRYRLGEVLGHGGMSTVYRASDDVLGRTVAIKVLSPALAEGDPVWVARFEREARAAAGLIHRGVATVYDTGVEDGTRFIVMECVRGRSLAEILPEEAPLKPGRAAEIGAQVADVLSAAHAAGIVHRDVKPGNIMVAPDGAVKVLDFGIARAADSAALTQTVSVLGTAAYMAPEQALGQRADARSDIYSLGCVLYAMLAGSPPFAGDLAAAVLHQHVNASPRPLRELAPAVPPALGALVEQMLAKSPEARPQSAAEVRDRLRAALDPTAATIALGSAGVDAPVSARRAGAPTARTRPLPPTRRAGAGRGLAIAAVIGLLLVLAVVAIASSGGSSGEKASSSTTTRSTTAPKATSTPSTTSTTPPSSSTTPPSSSTTPPNSSTSTPAAAPPAPAAPKDKTKPPGHGGAPPGQAKKAKGGKDGGG